jgi:hypothetical protein
MWYHWHCTMNPHTAACCSKLPPCDCNTPGPGARRLVGEAKVGASQFVDGKKRVRSRTVGGAVLHFVALAGDGDTSCRHDFPANLLVLEQDDL